MKKTAGDLAQACGVRVAVPDLYRSKIAYEVRFFVLSASKRHLVCAASSLLPHALNLLRLAGRGGQPSHVGSGLDWRRRGRARRRHLPQVAGADAAQFRRRAPHERGWLAAGAHRAIRADRSDCFK